MRTRRTCNIDQSLQCDGVGMAEGKTNAAGKRSIAQAMRADSALLAPFVTTKAATQNWIPAFAGMSGNQQVRDCKTERLHSLSFGYISRARAAFRQNLQQPCCRNDRIGAGHTADKARTCPIAADGNT